MIIIMVVNDIQSLCVQVNLEFLQRWLINFRLFSFIYKHYGFKAKKLKIHDIFLLRFLFIFILPMKV